MRCNASLCELHIVHSGMNALTIVHPVQGGSRNMGLGVRVRGIEAVRELASIYRCELILGAFQKL